MLANIIGGIIIGIIIYYIGKVLYKKINPNSDCGSCNTCDQSCPFAGGNYDIDYEMKENDNNDKIDEINDIEDKEK